MYSYISENNFEPSNQIIVPTGYKVYMCMCPNPNGFQDAAISLYRDLNLAPYIFLPSRRTAPC